MLGQSPINNGWSSCGSCVGSTYVDSSGNATGNGTAVVSSGISLGGCQQPISGWLIAAALGVVLLVSSHHKKGRERA